MIETLVAIKDQQRGRESPLRVRLLEAATERVAGHGWSNLTMSALAADAGVSRQSVYNEIGTKRDLAEALVQQEFGMFLGAVVAAISKGTDPVDSVRRAALSVLKMAAQNPLLHAAINPTAASSDLLPLVTVGAAPLMDAATDVVDGALIANHDVPASPEHTRAVAVIVRLVFSMVTNPPRVLREGAADVAWVAASLFSAVTAKDRAAPINGR